MSIGDRRHLLTFQVKTDPETPDRWGQGVPDWADSFEVYGAFEPIGTREFPSFQKMNSETTARFRIPKRSGIDPAIHRVVMVEDYDESPVVTGIWNIQAPTPVDGKPFELHIEAVRST